MLKEDPFASGWDISTISQELAVHLSGSETLLLAFALCCMIAVGAALSIFRSAVSDANVPGATRQMHPGNSHETTVPFAGSFASPRTRGTADELFSSINLGYSALNRGKCRWKRDAIQPFAESTRWLCSACNGFSFSNDQQVPTTCRAYDPKQRL